MQNFNRPVLNFLTVRTKPGEKSKGFLLAANRILPCALGRSGVGTKRGEGDGITPRGDFYLHEMRVRADRISLRAASFSLQPIAQNDGWCDEPGDRNYNKPVQLPYPASHENLYRDDHLYDVVLVMDHNISQHMGVGGSAIFFHLAHADYRPTEGCVAISRADMLWLLPRIGPETIMKIV